MIGRLVVSLALVGSLSVEAAAPVIVNLQEGTDIRLALSPDGATLVTDLAGRLWSLPATGGGATPLTSAEESARAPHFSPDGTHLVFACRRDEHWEVCELDLGDRSVTQLTDPPYDDRDPVYADHGSAVVFTSNRSGSDQLWRLGLADRALSQLTFGAPASGAAVSDFGDIAYIEREGARWSLRVIPPGAARSNELVSSTDPLAAPSWRPGGGVIVYEQLEAGSASVLKMLVLSEDPVAKTLTAAEDVFPGPVAWLGPDAYLYAADGQIWRRGLALTARYPVPLIAAVGVTPLAHVSAGSDFFAPGPHPVQGLSRLEPAPNGRQFVFSALGDIWLATRSGALRQLTDDPYVDRDPSFIDGGDAVVFTSDRGGKLALWQVRLADNALEPLGSGDARAYFPSVSPDERRVAFLSTEALGPWGEASLKLLELGKGKPITLATQLLAPSRPVWKTDGSALTLEASVDDGRPARRQSREIEVPAAASADGTTPTERVPRDPPRLTLSFKRPGAESEPYVVEVGRLFDGIHTDYRHHMDLHIEGGRLTAVVARGLEPLPAKVVDARDLTIVPGLIDLHVHESALAGERLGRCWLYHGVTTVREISDDLPDALERAETWAAGRSLGPRVVIAPAAGTVVATPTSLPVAPSPAPILVGTVHTLDAEWARQGLAALPPGLEGRVAAGAPHADLRFSPLGLSYEDVTGVLAAGGGVLVPSLAAIDPAPPRAPVGRNSPCEQSAVHPGHVPDGFVDGFDDTLRALLAAGGHIGVGSEAPVTPYGVGLHEELGRLAAAGIANDRLLRLATAEAALALGLDADLGTLEAGKLADFIVIDGDPLARLSDLEHIVAVVKDGVWIERSRLLRP